MLYKEKGETFGTPLAQNSWSKMKTGKKTIFFCKCVCLTLFLNMANN